MKALSGAASSAVYKKSRNNQPKTQPALNFHRYL